MDSWEHQSLPHGIIIRGVPGTGKYHLALRFAQALLCSARNQERLPCGNCSGCRLYRAGTHPDARVVAPEEGSRSIVVEQIRDLANYATLTRHAAPTKVCVIAPAEAMNQTAQNTLLKTLEEPPGAMVFLLVSHLGTELLPTIRSRCQHITIGVPGAEQLNEWLVANGVAPEAVNDLMTLSHGAPLLALELMSGDEQHNRREAIADCAGLIVGRDASVQVAAKWAKRATTDTLIENCLEVIHDLARRKVGLEGKHPALDDVAINEIDSGALYALHDTCVELRRVMRSNFGRNEQLALESLTLGVSRLGT